MSKLSVRAIVLSGLAASKSVDEIVVQIREDRPDSQAGSVEVKWYISKMKKEGFLCENGGITDKGISWVNKQAFRTSKTQITADSGITLKTAQKAVKTVVQEVENMLLKEFESNLESMSAKELTTYLKELCKKLDVPFYKKVDKKDEKKADKIVRLRQAVTNA